MSKGAHKFIPDTCGSCAYYAGTYQSNTWTGHCHCWRVKNKHGDYVKKKHGDPACEHYVPLFATWAPISY